MLSEMFSGMRRYKRVARFVDRKKMKQTVKATRIGRQSISFTGDFPEAGDWTPVETFGCRRSYMQPAREQGLERVIGTEDVGRLSIFSEHGVRLGAAVAMLVVLAAVLGGAWVMAHADNAGVAKRLAQQETRMQTLETQTTTLRSEIASRSSGVNVRQEAVRIAEEERLRAIEEEKARKEAEQQAAIEAEERKLKTKIRHVLGRIRRALIRFLESL